MTPISSAIISQCISYYSVYAPARGTAILLLLRYINVPTMQKGWKSQFFANALTNDYDNQRRDHIYILHMLDDYFRMN